MKQKCEPQRQKDSLALFGSCYKIVHNFAVGCFHKLWLQHGDHDRLGRMVGMWLALLPLLPHLPHISIPGTNTGPFLVESACSPTTKTFCCGSEWTSDVFLLCNDKQSFFSDDIKMFLRTTGFFCSHAKVSTFAGSKFRVWRRRSLNLPSCKRLVINDYTCLHRLNEWRRNRNLS